MTLEETPEKLKWRGFGSDSPEREQVWGVSWGLLRSWGLASVKCGGPGSRLGSLPVPQEPALPGSHGPSTVGARPTCTSSQMMVEMHHSPGPSRRMPLKHQRLPCKWSLCEHASLTWEDAMYSQNWPTLWWSLKRTCTIGVGHLRLHLPLFSPRISCGDTNPGRL